MLKDMIPKGNCGEFGQNSLSPGRYFGRNSLCPGNFDKNTRHSYANIATYR
jgi:hypothetical protein